MRRLAACVAMALVLAGCGQKGDLYLPEETDDDRAAVVGGGVPAA